MVFEVHGKVYNWAWFCQQLIFCVFSHLCCRCHDIVKLFSLFLLSTSGNKLFGFTTQFTNSQILARKSIEKLYVHFRSFCAWASLNRRHSDFHRYRFLFGFRLQIFSLSFYWQINRFESLIAVWEATKYIYLTFQHRFAFQPLNLLYYGIVWSHFTPINLTFGCFFFKLFITHLIYFVMALEFYRF